MRSLRISCAFALPIAAMASFAVFLRVSAVAEPPAPLQRTAEEYRVLQAGGVPERNDFAMGPGRMTMELAPGEEKTVEVQIDSTKQGLHTYQFETEDFGMAGDGSPNTTLFGAVPGPYPARAWVHPAVPSVRLNFGERAFVPVTVKVPKGAEPGDRYAALLLRRTLGPSETTERGFNIVSRVGTLFLITVKGPVQQEAELLSLRSRKKLYWFFPAFLELRAKNTGTVYAAPTGVIQIRNILGLVVDEIPVKDWYILRNSERSLTLPWHPRFALGRYTATAPLTAFGKAMPDPGTVTTSFWMIPALPVLLAIFAIFAVSFLVQFFRSRFEIRRKS